MIPAGCGKENFIIFRRNTYYGENFVLHLCHKAVLKKEKKIKTIKAKNFPKLVWALQALPGAQESPWHHPPPTLKPEHFLEEKRGLEKRAEQERSGHSVPPKALPSPDSKSLSSKESSDQLFNQNTYKNHWGPPTAQTIQSLGSQKSESKKVNVALKCDPRLSSPWAKGAKESLALGLPIRMAFK